MNLQNRYNRYCIQWVLKQSNVCVISKLSFFLMHDVSKLSSTVPNVFPVFFHLSFCISSRPPYCLIPSFPCLFLPYLPSSSLTFLSLRSHPSPPSHPLCLLLSHSSVKKSHIENVSPYEEQAEGQRQSQVHLPSFHV